MLKMILAVALTASLLGCTSTPEPTPADYGNIVKAPANMASSADDMILTPDGQLVLK